MVTKHIAMMTKHIVPPLVGRVCDCTNGDRLPKQALQWCRPDGLSMLRPRCQLFAVYVIIRLSPCATLHCALPSLLRTACCDAKQSTCNFAGIAKACLKVQALLPASIPVRRAHFHACTSLSAVCTVSLHLVLQGLLTSEHVVMADTGDCIFWTQRLRLPYGAGYAPQPPACVIYLPMSCLPVHN
jgi:hypothetical protein